MLESRWLHISVRLDSRLKKQLRIQTFHPPSSLPCPQDPGRQPNASKGLSASPGQEKRGAGEHLRFGFSPKFSCSYFQFCPSLGLFATAREQSGDYRGPDKFQKLLTPLIIQRKNQFYLL
ncbi:putative E3 ubiquitin-protein ligase ARI7 [Fusarium oxysporum f. sp. albedinis]|nr:putative E3 ubiquitin-protein ligase ARI7 [Fusarium oxysporum f. sp. albedinis]